MSMVEDKVCSTGSRLLFAWTPIALGTLLLVLQLLGIWIEMFGLTLAFSENITLNVVWLLLSIGLIGLGILYMMSILRKCPPKPEM